MLASLCGAGGGGFGLALALFAGGLAGGMVHCAPMCGPFVLAQVSGRLGAIPAHRLCERQRLTSGVLAPYHLGRLSTYALLGAAAAAPGAALRTSPVAGWLSALLLLFAAALFLAEAVRRLAPHARWSARIAAPQLPRAAAAWARGTARVVKRLDRSRPRSGFLLGLTLGLLPCGFLYAALAAAAAARQPALGALAMVAFGLGTMPSLVAVGIAGSAGGRIWSRVVVPLAPAVLLFNAALLTLLAWQRLQAGV